jgi:hypothetical protein
MMPFRFWASLKMKMKRKIFCLKVVGAEIVDLKLTVIEGKLESD